MVDVDRQPRFHGLLVSLADTLKSRYLGHFFRGIHRYPGFPEILLIVRNDCLDPDMAGCFAVPKALSLSILQFV
jgi:hypothetical protein